MFEELSSKRFKDADMYLSESQYKYACSLEEFGDYKSAYELLSNKLSLSYEDVAIHLGQVACKYGEALLSEGDYLGAFSVISEASSLCSKLDKQYSDRIKEACDKGATVAFNKKDYQNAFEYFKMNDNCDKESEIYKETLYQLSCNSTSYLEAIQSFEELGDYKDSKEKRLEKMYEYVKKNKKADDANTVNFLKELKANSYKDSSQIYSELFAWKVSIAINTAYADMSHMQSINIYNNQIVFHIKLSGGAPGASTRLASMIYTSEGFAASGTYSSGGNDAYFYAGDIAESDLTLAPPRNSFPSGTMRIKVYEVTDNGWNLIGEATTNLVS